MSASWALESGAPSAKYQLALQLGESRVLRGAALQRSLVLNETLDDAIFDDVVLGGLQTGDAIFRQTRWIHCRFDAPELSATRFEGSYFSGTRFVNPMLRAVVFDRCVFDRSGYELPDVPTAAMLRFERCVFVDMPVATEKRWRDAGLVSDDCLFVMATEAPAVAVPVVAASPAKEKPAVPPSAPVAPTPAPAGRFAALER